MPPINRKKKLIRWNKAVRVLEAKKKGSLKKKKKVKEEELPVSHFMKVVKEEFDGSKGDQRVLSASPSSQTSSNVKVVERSCEIQPSQPLPRPSSVNMSSPLSIGNLLTYHQHQLNSNAKIRKYFESVHPFYPDVMEVVELHNSCRDAALQRLYKVNIGVMVQMSKIMQELCIIRDMNKKLPLLPDSGKFPLPRLRNTKFGIASPPSTSFKFITMENFYFQDCDFNLVYAEERYTHAGMYDDEEEYSVAYFMQACLKRVLKNPAFACCLTSTASRIGECFICLPAEFKTTMRDFILVIAEKSVTSEYANALNRTLWCVIDRMRTAALLTYAANYHSYLQQWPRNYSSAKKKNKIVFPRQILPPAKNRVLQE